MSYQNNGQWHIFDYIYSVVSPDAFPFGPNNPDPPPSASKSDPPAFGPNCVGCISTQNLANGAVTNPKLAAGSVSSADMGAGQVMTPNIAPFLILYSFLA